MGKDRVFQFTVEYRSPGKRPLASLEKRDRGRIAIQQVMVKATGGWTVVSKYIPCRGIVSGGKENTRNRGASLQLLGFNGNMA